jgi:hypothetical protein
MALSQTTGYEDVVARGARWLLAQYGAEPSFVARFARFVMGVNASAIDRLGWPWFPGSAAWVIPTSLAICALSRLHPDIYGRDISRRAEEARRFLLSRRCPDQGWNHGGLYRPGEMPASYPETTGIALLALRGVDVRMVEGALRCGERHARDPKSSEGESWLRLGLLAHGRNPQEPPATYRDWNVNQLALRIIARCAETGNNPFLRQVQDRHV